MTKSFISGWILSIAFSTLVILLTPVGVTALCEYGNCETFTTCGDNYCVTENFEGAYFDSSCPDPFWCEHYFCVARIDSCNGSVCGGDHDYRCL
jgi:hypothetical protein